MAVSIIINNNKCKVIATLKTIAKLREETRIRVDGAFFSPAFQKRQWDGYKYYITESGNFDTGLLEKFIGKLESWDKKVRLVDERENPKLLKIPSKIKELKTRDYQEDALMALANKSVKSIPFYRGVYDCATNSGKTLLCAGVYKMFQKKTILLFNRKEIYQETKQGLMELIPDKLGFIDSNSRDVQWNKVMICMVPTMLSRWNKVVDKLHEFEVCLVDECDLSTNKSYQKVLTRLINTTVRVGLTGSAFKHKNKNKNEQLKAFFGEVLYKISNRELMDKGYSTEVQVTIRKGSAYVGEDYENEYEYGIIKNRQRNQDIIDQTSIHLSLKHLPALIITKRKKHVKRLYRKALRELNPVYVIDWVHSGRKDRAEVIKRFKNGDIDVLIGSLILSRAKNFPLMQYLNNAAGGDSQSLVLQILGRCTRTSEGKLMTYLDDYFDGGRYLKRHSKHRVIFYKTEKLKVNEIYK